MATMTVTSTTALKAHPTVHARRERPTNLRPLDINLPVKTAEPFDINELCRRLRIQERRQQEQDEERRRRRARDECNKQKYHHTPRVAAADFARTATPDTLGKKGMHPLSHTVFDRYQHNGALSPTQIGGSLSAGQLADALEEQRLANELLGQRNQFQQPRGFEEAAQRDRERDLYKPTQRAFRTSLFPPEPTRCSNQERSFSVGDAELLEVGAGRRHSTISKPKPRPSFRWEDHHDWAQRDESCDERRPSLIDRMSPLLKKTESVLHLRGKRDSVIKESSSSPAPSEPSVEGEASKSPTSPKSPRSPKDSKGSKSPKESKSRRNSQFMAFFKR
ncbi:MAG: hypothetical protein M1817_002686 [Caeruleum heppii]|nr:MAG: hypothetical protein M1817_002686 [Caeruleum heppii]